MSNREYRIRLVVLLLGCIGCALGWLWLHREFQQTNGMVTQLALLNQARELRLTGMRDAQAAVRFRGVPEDALPPDERRRQRVTQLIATLKEAPQKETTPRLRIPPPPTGPSGDTFDELMGDPEYARLTMVLWRYGWQARHKELYRWAGVPDEKQAELHRLILEVGFSRTDAAEAARANGGSKAKAELAGWEAMSGVYAEMRTLLGEEAYARILQMQEQHGTNNIPDLVKAFETRLSYSGVPLTPEQTQRIYDAAIEEQVGFMMKPGQVDALVERVRPALLPTQLAAFRQVATEYNYGKSSR